MGWLRNWFKNRELELGDFAPVYGSHFRRPNRLEKKGIGPPQWHYGKLGQGETIVDWYSIGCCLTAAAAFGYIKDCII